MKQDIPLIGPILNKIIGSRNDRFVKKYLARATAINALEPKFRKLSDKDLRGQVEVFRARIDKGESAADVMAEAFAVAREAMDRSVGIRQIFNRPGSLTPRRCRRASRTRTPGPRPRWRRRPSASPMASGWATSR